MSDRYRRTRFNFSLGEAIELVESDQLLMQASAHLKLATAAFEEGDWPKSHARIAAAIEAVDELRKRGTQLTLRM